MGAGATAGIVAATQAASDDELATTLGQLPASQKQKLLAALASLSGEDGAAAAPAKRERFEWPPLESNPEVFTDYMHRVGLHDSVVISEVFGFDEDLLGFLSMPVFGVIVNIERLKKQEDKARGDPESASMVDFYMKQSGSLDNACGIIAAIHCVLNTGVAFADDSILGAFANDTKDKTPDERCTALETNDAFKEQHAGAAEQGQTEAVHEDQSAVRHHFIAFVVKNGKLIELDGTKLGPRVIGDSDDVLRGSIQEIQRRLALGEISEQMSMMVLNAASTD